MLLRFVAAALLVTVLNIIFADFLLVKIWQAGCHFVSIFRYDFRMLDALINLFLLETRLRDLVELKA